MWSIWLVVVSAWTAVLGEDFVEIDAMGAYVGGRLFFQEAGGLAVLVHADFATPDMGDEHIAVGVQDSRILEALGVGKSLVDLGVVDKERDVGADRVELLARGHSHHIKGLVHPTEAVDVVFAGRFGFPVCGSHLVEKLVGVGVQRERGAAHERDGVGHQVVGVALVATRHHKSLAGVVDDTGVVVDVLLGAVAAAHIDEFAILDHEGLGEGVAIVLGGIYFAINHKVFGRYDLQGVVLSAAGEQCASQGQQCHCNKCERVFHFSVIG